MTELPGDRDSVLILGGSLSPLTSQVALCGQDEIPANSLGMNELRFSLITTRATSKTNYSCKLERD